MYPILLSGQLDTGWIFQKRPIITTDSTFTFVIEPVFKHKKGVATYVMIQNCDKNIYEFYDELDKQMLALKNPFVEPVFLISRQFKNAYGVFGSYAVSDSVLFVYPE